MLGQDAQSFVPKQVLSSCFYGQTASCIQRLNWCDIYAGCDKPALDDEYLARPRVGVIGVFDGLHEGHCTLISTAVAEAKRTSAVSCAITFYPDPSCVLGGVCKNAYLMPLEARIKGLLALGIDEVLVISFDKVFAALDYKDFISNYLLDVRAFKRVFVGKNFKMGYKGLGTVEALQSYANQLGTLTFEAIDLVNSDGVTISSTAIRKLVQQGSVDKANELLDRMFWAEGIVQHGRGQGSTLGFPTANVAIDTSMCAPTSGVYAGYGFDGHTIWPAAINMGKPLSFASNNYDCAHWLAEVNLIDANLDLYNKSLKVFFVTKLRDAKRFESLNVLKDCVQEDITWVKTQLGSRFWEV